ncbi:MAG: Gldg family protein [Myxococcota bacterium]
MWNSFKLTQTVFTKELKRIIISPMFYILLMIWIFITGFITFNTFEDYGYLTFKSYFQTAPYLLLFMTAALTSGQLNESKLNLDLNTILPLGNLELVFAKYLTDLVVVIVLIALGLTIPLSVEIAGWAQIDTGSLFAANCGLFLLGSVLIALGLAVSVIFRSQSAAFLVTLATAFIFWVPSLLISIIPPSIREIFLYFSFLFHQNQFAKGLVPLQGLVFFLTFTALFIYGAVFLLEKRKYQAGLPKDKLMWPLIALMSFVFVNLFAYRIEKRIDFTAGQIHSLSSSSKKIISQLPQDIKINFFVSADLPLKFKPYSKEVIRLLRKYETDSAKIKVEVLHPDKSSRARKLASNYQIGKIEVGSKTTAKTRLNRIFFGIAVVKGEKVEVLPEVISYLYDNRDNSASLEYELTLRLKRISYPARKIILSSGHEEFSDPLYPQKNSGFKFMIERLQEFKFELVDLEKKDISPKTDLLMIAGPKAEFSAEAQERIKKFITSGRPVLFALDGMKFKWDKVVKGAPLHWIPNKTGLNKLLQEYGIRLNHDMVLSFKAPKIPVKKHKIMTYPLMPEIMVNRKLRIFPFTLSSLDLDKTKRSRFKKILKTDPGAWRHADVYEENHDWPTTKDRGPFNTGVFYRDSKQNVRFFIIGDSDLFRDRNIDAVNTHIIFLRHMLNLLLGDDQLGKLSFKGISLVRLDFNNKIKPDLLKMYFIGTGLALIFFIGLCVNLIRRKRFYRKKTMKGK